MRWLDQKASSKTYSACLQTIRLLSRDKAGLDTLMTSDVLATLVRHSGLDSYSQSQGELITNQQGDPNGRWRKEVFSILICFHTCSAVPVNTNFIFLGDFFTHPASFCSESSLHFGQQLSHDSPKMIRDKYINVCDVWC